MADLSLEGAAAKVAGKWFVAGVLPVGSSEEGEEGGGGGEDEMKRVIFFEKSNICTGNE